MLYCGVDVGGPIRFITVPQPACKQVIPATANTTPVRRSMNSPRSIARAFWEEGIAADFLCAKSGIEQNKLEDGVDSTRRLPLPQPAFKPNIMAEYGEPSSRSGAARAPRHRSAPVGDPGPRNTPDRENVGGASSDSDDERAILAPLRFRCAGQPGPGPTEIARPLLHCCVHNA